MTARDERWSQLAQWHYELGWIEGYAHGRADADAELVGAMAEALGGPGETDYRQAVKAHERAINARAARAAADRGEVDVRSWLDDYARRAEVHHWHTLATGLPREADRKAARERLDEMRAERSGDIGAEAA